MARTRGHSKTVRQFGAGSARPVNATVAIAAAFAAAGLGALGVLGLTSRGQKRRSEALVHSATRPSEFSQGALGTQTQALDSSKAAVSSWAIQVYQPWRPSALHPSLEAHTLAKGTQLSRNGDDAERLAVDDNDVLNTDLGKPASGEGDFAARTTVFWSADDSTFLHAALLHGPSGDLPAANVGASQMEGCAPASESCLCATPCELSPAPSLMRTASWASESAADTCSVTDSRRSSGALELELELCDWDTEAGSGVPPPHSLDRGQSLCASSELPVTVTMGNPLFASAPAPEAVSAGASSALGARNHPAFTIAVDNPCFAWEEREGCEGGVVQPLASPIPAPAAATSSPPTCEVEVTAAAADPVELVLPAVAAGALDACPQAEIPVDPVTLYEAPCSPAAPATPTRPPPPPVVPLSPRPAQPAWGQPAGSAGMKSPGPSQVVPRCASCPPQRPGARAAELRRHSLDTVPATAQPGRSTATSAPDSSRPPWRPSSRSVLTRAGPVSSAAARPGATTKTVQPCALLPADSTTSQPTRPPFRPPSKFAKPASPPRRVGSSKSAGPSTPRSSPRASAEWSGLPSFMRPTQAFLAAYSGGSASCGSGQPEASPAPELTGRCGGRASRRHGAADQRGAGSVAPAASRPRWR